MTPGEALDQGLALLRAEVRKAQDQAAKEVEALQARVAVLEAEVAALSTAPDVATEVVPAVVSPPAVVTPPAPVPAATEAITAAPAVVVAPPAVGASRPLVQIFGEGVLPGK